ncbi:hypothetical protein BDB01DRAFT_786467, partial [Pilobolus umbonatus]
TYSSVYPVYLFLFFVFVGEYLNVNHEYGECFLVMKYFVVIIIAFYCESVGHISAFCSSVRILDEERVKEREGERTACLCMYVY